MRIVTVARKPCSEGSTTANVARYSCGALNIDGTRIVFTDDPDLGRTQRNFDNMGYQGMKAPSDSVPTYKPGGRWPANVVLALDAVPEMDRQSGIRKTTWISPAHQNNRDGEFLGKVGHPGQQGYNDTGTASRFFKQVRA